MARDIDGIIQEKFAADGDVGLEGLDILEGWPISYSTPGGIPPKRLQFNQLYRSLFALAKEINQKGPYLEYNATIDYAVKARVIGSDGILYVAVVPNGPSSSVVNPVENPSTWTALSIAVSSIYGLLQISLPDDNQDFMVNHFYDGIDGGGGKFWWDSGRDKADADAVLVFDPDNIGGWDGSQGTIAATLHGVSGQGTGTGTGCWVRITEATAVASNAGIVGNGFDETALIQVILDNQVTPSLSFLVDSYITSSTISIPSNRHIFIGPSSGFVSSAAPVFKYAGEYSSLRGAGKDSYVRTTVASPNGVVLMGHGTNTETTKIQYNGLSSLNLIGADSFGSVGAFQTDYTVGLMLFNSQNWGTGGIVYYNDIENMFIQDVKDGIVLAGIINANIFSNILFWRIGQTALSLFSPFAADGFGDRYGYDWDTTTLDSAGAENSFSNIFVDTAFAAYDVEPGYASRAFLDGQTYPSVGTCLRFEGHTSYNRVSNFLAEPTYETGYQIGADTLNTTISGAFNVSPVGVNNAVAVDNGCSVLNGSGGEYADLNIRNANLYLTKVMATGSEAAPAIHDRFSDNTGIYFPTPGVMGFTSGGSEVARADSNGFIVGTKTPIGGFALETGGGDIYLNGDCRLKTTYPIADNTYSIGIGSFRWSVVYAATGTINTSDARDKQQIRDLTDAEKSVAIKCKSLLRSFKFNDAVNSKGEDARIHFGIIAQDLATAFGESGLNADDYGMFCYDEWDAVEAVLDDDGNVTKEATLLAIGMELGMKSY